MVKFLFYVIFFSLCIRTEAECGIFDFWKPAENYDYLDSLQDPFINLEEPTREMRHFSDLDQRTLRNLYGFPQDLSIDEGLLLIISSLTKKVQSDLKNANLYYLMIGDAEHWLGHFKEDQYSWTEAWRAYIRSLQAYAKTTYEFSPLINILHVRDHAIWHIARLYIVSNQPIPPELTGNLNRQSNKVLSKQQMEEIINDILKSAPLENRMRTTGEIDQNTQEMNSIIRNCNQIFQL